MIKLRKKDYVIIISLVVIIGMAVAVLVTKFVEQRLELELSRKFLYEHTEIFSQLSHIKSIDYTRHSAAGVSFKKEKNEGFYTFSIEGNEDKLDVRLFWENSKEGNDFCVKRVELLRGGDKPEILWQSAEKLP